MLSIKRRVGRQRRGFTLLELILVMIILCTMLAMAAPSLKGFFSSRRIMDVAEQIIMLTRYAKTQSIYQSRYYRLNFDLNEKEYWLSVLDKSQYRNLETGLGSEMKIPADISIEFENVPKTGGIEYIEFNPQGYSNQCRLRLEDTKENVVEVVCYSPAENFELIELFDGKDDIRE